MLRLQDGPAVVAGRSYGGQVVTALGADAPNAAALVYVAAFAIDKGEALGALLAQGPTPPAIEHLYTDPNGLVWLLQDDFVAHFAGGVDPVRARVLHAVQQPIAGAVFGDDEVKLALVRPAKATTSTSRARRHAIAASRSSM